MSDMRENKIIQGQELLELPPNQIVYASRGQDYVPGANNTGIVLHQELLSKHILCLGAIGSGKTVMMKHIIRAVRDGMGKNDIIVFFDAKGDYLEEFYEDGDFVISNATEPPPGTIYWNIYQDLLALEQAKRDDMAREIATTLFKEDIESSSSPIFAAGARDLFAAILSAQVREMENGEESWDHEKLISFLQKATDVTIRNLLLKHNDLAWVRNYIRKENSASTNQSYLSHLYQNLFNIFSGCFAKPSSYSLLKTLREKGGRALFLEYDLANGAILRPVYTLMLDLAMKEVLGRSRTEGSVYFILDEFPLVPRLNYMDNALNFGRSLGVKIIAGIQNTGQVEHVYGPALGESLMSGFGTMFAFRLFDARSRGLVATRHGRNQRLVSIMSTNSSKGIQDQVLEGNVIEDWDLTSLKVGECITSIYDKYPFVFRPLNYTR